MTDDCYRLGPNATYHGPPGLALRPARAQKTDEETASR